MKTKASNHLKVCRTSQIGAVELIVYWAVVHGLERRRMENTTQKFGEAINQLSQVKIFDYFKKRRMPDFVEPVVTQMIKAFLSSDQNKRRELTSIMIPPETCSTLGWYARKLAGRAVRDRPITDLRKLFAHPPTSTPTHAYRQMGCADAYCQPL
jgi:hypothetical protein